MKFDELLENQRLTIQLLWGEQKIEFFSTVIEKNDSEVYVSPYLHNGSELELNILPGKGVICNIFTDDPTTKQRVSWKNVELTTVQRNTMTLYYVKTSGYNHMAMHDDRRMHERMLVQDKAQIFESGSAESVEGIVHDVSDIGISFYAPKTFAPKARQLTVIFQDVVDGSIFDIKVECTITRMTNKAGNLFVGCRIVKESKEYQLYCFMKRLKDKKNYVGR